MEPRDYHRESEGGKLPVVKTTVLRVDAKCPECDPKFDDFEHAPDTSDSDDDDDDDDNKRR